MGGSLQQLWNPKWGSDDGRLSCRISNHSWYSGCVFRPLSTTMAALMAACSSDVGTLSGDECEFGELAPVLDSGVGHLGRARLGASIAGVEDFAAVGAPTYDSSGLIDSGLVVVFQRIDDASWSVRERLEPQTPWQGAMFGVSLQMSSSYLVVGSPGSLSPVGVRSGSVHVFVRAVSGGWVFVDELFPPVEADSASFGASLAMADDAVVVVGAPGLGAVFRVDLDSLEVRLLAEEPLLEQFGSVVEAESNEVLVGLPTTESDGVRAAGRAFILQGCSLRSGASSCSRMTEFMPPQLSEGAEFGRSIAVLAGGLVAIGAPRASPDPSAPAPDGRVYLFDRESAELRREIELSGEGAQLGEAMAACSDTLAIGMPLLRNAEGSRSGGVLILETPDASPRVVLSGEEAIANGGFGSELEFVGATLLVSEPEGGEPERTGRIFTPE